MSSLPIWNSSSLPLNYLIHNNSQKKKKKKIIHNKHAHKYIGSERGKRVTRKRETFTPWELGLGTASHTRKREEVLLLKSEMGLLCRRRNRMSLKLRRSFGSNSDGKERGFDWRRCSCGNGLKDMQLWQWIEEMQLRRGERESEREKISVYVWWNSGRAVLKQSGRVLNFLMAKWSFCHLVRCQDKGPLD